MVHNSAILLYSQYRAYEAIATIKKPLQGQVYGVLHYFQAGPAPLQIQGFEILDRAVRVRHLNGQDAMAGNVYYVGILEVPGPVRSYLVFFEDRKRSR